jgi:GNAT superfamily N-acetyltransferase
LQSLAVTEEFRRKGIGDQLLQASEAWGRDRGAVELHLDILEFAAGPLEFYEKAGYHRFRRTLTKNL